MAVAQWRGGACRPASQWGDEAAEVVTVRPGTAPMCPCGHTLAPGTGWWPEPGSTGAVVIRPRCRYCGQYVRVRLLVG